MEKNIELIKKMLGNKIFTVTFEKKNGELRKMNARLGVTKALKGGEKRYNTDDLNYLTVFDLQANEYRTVNLNTLKELSFKGETITF